MRIKDFLPRTLFGRSLMIIVTPMLLLQIVTAVVFVDRHWSKMSQRLAFAVAGEIAVLAEQVEAREPANGRADLFGNAVRNLDLFVSFEPGGVMDAGARDLLAREEQRSIVVRTLARELRRTLDYPFMIDLDLAGKWVEVSVQLPEGLLHVAILESRLFSSSAYVFLLWVVFSSLFLFAIAILFMRNQIRPIRRLAIAAERFGKGRDVPHFKPEGAREVRQAAEAFLEMHERIKRQISQRTEMLAGVSHDLKTPLTRLRLSLAMLAQTPDTEAMKEDIAEMERMLNGYLDFARGQGNEQVSRVDLGAMLENVAGATRRLGTRISLSFEGEAEGGGLWASLRPVGFERALNNLIGNARKYGENIWISARRREDSIEIVVEDDGPGIPDSELEEVFRPFYRVDRSRNMSTGGVGLGLPIAMDIISAHGGRIWLEKSRHGGLRAVIQLPV